MLLALRGDQLRQRIPELQKPIRDPARFPWHEVTKVAHYYLSVDTLKQSMEIREGQKASGIWKTRDE